MTTALLLIQILFMIPFGLGVKENQITKSIESKRTTYINAEYKFSLKLPQKAVYNEFKDEKNFHVSFCYSEESLKAKGCNGLGDDDAISIEKFKDLDKKVKLTDNIHEKINAIYKPEYPLHYGWSIEENSEKSLKIIGKNTFLQVTTVGIKNVPEGIPLVTFYHLIKGDHLYTFKFYGYRTAAHIKTFMENFYFSG